MKKEKLKIIRFSPKGENSFFDDVHSQVTDYFETNNISPYGNKTMWFKTAFMLLLYFIPYVLIVSGIASFNTSFYLAMWALIGLGICGIGTAVMHDANHGSYSPNKKVNRTISYVLEVIGGYSVNWRIQHNILHHTYTNIPDLDEDIETSKFLRFSPNQPKKWYHRYQYIYAWLFYSLLTFFWMTGKDYVKAVKYRNHDLLIKEKVTFRKALVMITVCKLAFVSYALVLPLLFSGMPASLTIAGFFIMHAVGGLALACVFQPAHVIHTSDYAVPVTINGKETMENSWAVHEILNTSNFAMKNKALTWFIGGLNHQIEHHLFSGICHVHYSKIAPIVRAAAVKHGIPYNEVKTFSGALIKHTQMLKQLGK